MTGVGFIYAAAAAIGNSCIDGSRKMATQKFNPIELVTFVAILDALLLFALVAGFEKANTLSATFEASDEKLLRILVISSGIKVIAGFLYQKALHVSPLSVTVPYLAFTPVLLVVTSYFLMNEVPSSQGLLGVVVVTIGGYFLAIEHSMDSESKKGSRPPQADASNSSLYVSSMPRWLPGMPNSNEKLSWSSEYLPSENVHGDRQSYPTQAVGFKGSRHSFLEWVSSGHLLEPFHALRREEGSILMLGVAGLLSISNSLDKMGSHLAPSSLIFAASQKVIMAIPTAVFLLLTSPKSFSLLFQQLPALVVISMFEVVSFVCYLKSLETLLVSYSIAAKRSNVLISVIIGRIIFKEKIWRRLPFVLLMVGGMALIVFT